MCFIHDEEANVLDILPLFPAPGQDIPFIRSTDNDVSFSQKLQVCACFSSKKHHLLIQNILKLLVPVEKHLIKVYDVKTATKKYLHGSNQTSRNLFILVRPELP